MTIIDAQVHIWPPESVERPYVKEDASKPHRPIPLTYDRLLEEMKTAGVDRVILVPPSWEGYRNEYALEAAQKYPDRFRGHGQGATQRSGQQESNRVMAQTAGHARLPHQLS